MNSQGASIVCRALPSFLPLSFAIILSYPCNTFHVLCPVAEKRDEEVKWINWMNSDEVLLSPTAPPVFYSSSAHPRRHLFTAMALATETTNAQHELLLFVGSQAVNLALSDQGLSVVQRKLGESHPILYSAHRRDRNA